MVAPELPTAGFAFIIYPDLDLDEARFVTVKSLDMYTAQPFL